MLTKDDLHQLQILFDRHSTLIDKKLDQQSAVFDQKLDYLSGAFDEKLDQQTALFDTKLDQQRSSMMLDMRSMIREELEVINEKIDRLKDTEDADIRMLYGDFAKLNRSFKRLETQFVELKKHYPVKPS